MSFSKHKQSAILMIAGSALVGSLTPAYAYLDPGTGSIILQGLIASVAAAGAAGSLYWARIKAWFAERRGNSSVQDDTDGDLK